MVKLTAVKIGKLINRSPKYVYTLLHRKGISISDIDFEKLIDLIMQYRKTEAIYKHRFMKRIGRDKYEVWYANKTLRVEEIFTAICPHCKEGLEFPNLLPALVCYKCDGIVERFPIVKGVKEGQQIWHKDLYQLDQKIK